MPPSPINLGTAKCRPSQNGFFCPTGQDPPQNEAAGFLLRPRGRGDHRRLLLRRGGHFLPPPKRTIIIIGEQPQLVLWDPRLFLGVTVGVLAVIFIGSAYKTNELSGGGSSRGHLDGRTARQSQHHRSRTNASCSTWSRKWPSPPACPCRRFMCSTRSTAINAFAAGHTHRRRRHRRHARLHRNALARPIAGRHRPRIQPHS